MGPIVLEFSSSYYVMEYPSYECYLDVRRDCIHIHRGVAYSCNYVHANDTEMKSLVYHCGLIYLEESFNKELLRKIFSNVVL